MTISTVIFPVQVKNPLKTLIFLQIHRFLYWNALTILTKSVRSLVRSTQLQPDTLASSFWIRRSEVALWQLAFLVDIDVLPGEGRSAGDCPDSPHTRRGTGSPQNLYSLDIDYHYVEQIFGNFGGQSDKEN